jgi:hypothetical protein
MAHFWHPTIPTEGAPSLRFFARACPELAEGVGGDAAGATFVRSTLPVVDAVVVPALRKVREGRGTRSCRGFCSLKAGPPALSEPIWLLGLVFR